MIWKDPIGGFRHVLFSPKVGMAGWWTNYQPVIDHSGESVSKWMTFSLSVIFLSICRVISEYIFAFHCMRGRARKVCGRETWRKLRGILRKLFMNQFHSLMHSWNRDILGEWTLLLLNCFCRWRISASDLTHWTDRGCSSNHGIIFKQSLSEGTSPRFGKVRPEPAWGELQKTRPHFPRFWRLKEKLHFGHFWLFPDVFLTFFRENI